MSDSQVEYVDTAFKKAFDSAYQRLINTIKADDFKDLEANQNCSDIDCTMKALREITPAGFQSLTAADGPFLITLLKKMRVETLLVVGFSKPQETKRSFKRNTDAKLVFELLKQPDPNHQSLSGFHVIAERFEVSALKQILSLISLPKDDMLLSQMCQLEDANKKPVLLTFAKNEEKLALILANKSEKKRESFILQKNSAGDNVVHLAADDLDVLKSLKSNFGNSSFLKAATALDAKGEPPLHRLLKNGDAKTVNAFLNLFSQKEQQSLITQKNTKGETAFHLIGCVDGMEKFTVLRQHLHEQNSLFLKALKMPDSTGQTPLHKVAPILQLMRNIIVQYPEKEREALLMLKDKNNQSPLSKYNSDLKKETPMLDFLFLLPNATKQKYRRYPDEEPAVETKLSSLGSFFSLMKHKASRPKPNLGFMEEYLRNPNRVSHLRIWRGEHSQMKDALINDLTVNSTDKERVKRALKAYSQNISDLKAYKSQFEKFIDALYQQCDVNETGEKISVSIEDKIDLVVDEKWLPSLKESLKLR